LALGDARYVNKVSSACGQAHRLRDLGAAFCDHAVPPLWQGAMARFCRLNLIAFCRASGAQSLSVASSSQRAASTPRRVSISHLLATRPAPRFLSTMVRTVLRLRLVFLSDVAERRASVAQFQNLRDLCLAGAAILAGCRETGAVALLAVSASVSVPAPFGSRSALGRLFLCSNHALPNGNARDWFRKG
jgi:hypothetical protein